MEVTIHDAVVPDSVDWLVRHGYAIFDLTLTGPVPIDISAGVDPSNTRRSNTARYGEILASTKPGADIAALRTAITALAWPAAPPSTTASDHDLTGASAAERAAGRQVGVRARRQQQP